MSVLIDTSIWIEYLRGRPGAARDAFVHLLEGGDVATTDIVLLEVLVGPTDEKEASRLARLLRRATYLHQRSPDDVETAAALHRTCRRAGFTPRSRLDCLVAAVAIRNDVPVLHHDRDFDVIARHTALRIHRP